MNQTKIAPTSDDLPRVAIPVHGKGRSLKGDGKGKDKGGGKAGTSDVLMDRIEDLRTILKLFGEDCYCGDCNPESKHFRAAMKKLLEWRKR